LASRQSAAFFAQEKRVGGALPRRRYAGNILKEPHICFPVRLWQCAVGDGFFLRCHGHFCNIRPFAVGRAFVPEARVQKPPKSVRVRPQESRITQKPWWIAWQTIFRLVIVGASLMFLAAAAAADVQLGMQCCTALRHQSLQGGDQKRLVRSVVPQIPFLKVSESTQFDSHAQLPKLWSFMKTFAFRVFTFTLRA